ncbi:aminotransferase class V-fold PLP-dependent enzyme [Candidatus Bipolaricaulota bacterium]|nr:aminotransferase class V-fold PLP-dependent enzyme [Candidatus Bipolaricaulota bacterium]
MKDSTSCSDGDNRQSVVGENLQLPLVNGGKKNYVNLDNAATTPPLQAVNEKVSEFLKYYSSVGRGTGFKSRVSTTAVDEARDILADFVGSDRGYHTVIFTKHATEGINKVSKRIPFSEDDVIISTWLEHHANILPWRRLEKDSGVKVIHAVTNPEDGTLDVDDLYEKIDRYRDNLKLMTITGGSNVTGYLPPLKEISRAVHRVGAYFMVDAAQLAPHKPIDMGSPGSPDRIDFLAFSGHKMYAPYGVGVLIGPEHVFEDGEPEQQGGGAVDLVSQDFTLWRPPPAKEETGTPNAVGIVAIASAADNLTAVDMGNVEDAEEKLTTYTLERLTEIDGLTLFGPGGPSAEDRLGIFTFNLKGMSHHLVSAILSYDYGIATRSGCFCAHPYLLDMMRVPSDRINEVKKQVYSGVKANIAGAVRASLGLYNTREDVDKLVQALHEIGADPDKFSARYRKDERTGEYFPDGDLPDYRKYFSVRE